MNIIELCEKTWNSSYPDRRQWDQLEKDTQDEWIRVFSEYEKFRTAEEVDNIHINNFKRIFNLRAVSAIQKPNLKFKITFCLPWHQISEKYWNACKDYAEYKLPNDYVCSFVKRGVLICSNIKE